MNKADFTNAVAYRCSMTKAEAAKAIYAVFNTLEIELSNGNLVRLLGFGSFQVVDTPEKTVRNPQNGEEVFIPAKKRLKFIPGKRLKEEIQKLMHLN